VTEHQTTISYLHFSLGAVYCQRLQEGDNIAGR